MRLLTAFFISVAVILFIVFNIGCNASQELSTATPTTSPTSQYAMPTPTPIPTPTTWLTATRTPFPTDTVKPTITPMPDETGLFLEISQPLNEAQVHASPIAVVGRTIPNAVVSLLVNRVIEIADVDQNGDFSVAIDLEEGPNLIEVIASDQYGNENSINLIVSFVP